MSLSASDWTNTLYSNLQAKGFVGTQLFAFCNAVGQGSVSHVVGKTFTTSDTGVGVLGTGSGTGVVDLDLANISSLIFSFSVGSFGQFGTRLKDVCDAIAMTCVALMGAASLSTINPAVGIGSGNINTGSISVTGTDWGTDIQNAAPGFGGSQWPNFSQAIGKGQATDVIANGTGSVSISGGTAIPVTAGTGNGTIS